MNILPETCYDYRFDANEAYFSEDDVEDEE